MDGDATASAVSAAASASGFDAEAVVCAACSQSSGPFSKRQLKKAQAGEPARKFSSPFLMCLDHAFTLLFFSSAHTSLSSLSLTFYMYDRIYLINKFQLSFFRMRKMCGE